MGTENRKIEHGAPWECRGCVDGMWLVKSREVCERKCGLSWAMRNGQDIVRWGWGESGGQRGHSRWKVSEQKGTYVKACGEWPIM